MATIYEVWIANNLAMQNGQFGVKIATPATVLDNLGIAPGEYFYGIIEAIEPSTISLTARASIHGDSSISSLQLEAGDRICGKFNTLTVSAGKVFAYYGKEISPNY